MRQYPDYDTLVEQRDDLLLALKTMMSWVQVALNDHTFDNCVLPRGADKAMSQAFYIIDKVENP